MRSNQSDRDATAAVTVRINRFRDRLTTPHSPACHLDHPRTRLRGHGADNRPNALGLKIPEALLLRADEVIE